MYITDLYNLILDKLNGNGYQFISNDLENLSVAAATGGEGLESTGGYLFDLKESNFPAYQSIEDLVIRYLQYCKQNGIIIN